jgi:predicted dehydrogenase
MKAVIIGFGRMGQRHVQVVRELGLELVGVSDQKMAQLSDIAEKLQLPSAMRFEDSVKMIKAARPECVIVATTAPTHCEYTCLAAENGAKFILCEKPMAVSLEECDRMIACCRKNGALLAINHQMRFMEQYIEPKRIVGSEAFGGLSSITVLAGNFGLAMNGTHYFEMFRYLTDEAPKEVTAWFSSASVPNPRGPQFEDRAGEVRITTGSGKRFYMEASDDQGHGVQVIYAGRYGQLMIDELAGLMRWFVREEPHRALPTTRYGMPWTETTRKIAPADVIAPSKAVLKALLEKKDYPTEE